MTTPKAPKRDTTEKDTVGIYRHGSGWIAVVSHGRSRPQTRRHFPQGTTPEAMQNWRKDVQARARVARKGRTLSGTLEVDARRYLQAVTALPSYSDRCYEIAAWLPHLGHRRRDQIGPGDIRKIRDRWLMEPRAEDDKRPLGPGTVNKRLRALSNLWRVLDGKQAYNPVRDVDEAKEPEPVARALDYQTIERIIDAMSVHRGGLYTKNAPEPDWTPKHPALSPVRVRILAYTGLSLSSLKRITPADVDYEHQRLRLPTRKKGRGVAAKVVPLLPPAAQAFRDLERLNGFGHYDNRSLRYAFTKAAVRAGVGHVRLHDLRHSLGTIAYELTGSTEVVMAFLQHASLATTKRYTMAAAWDVLKQQSAPLERHFSAPPATPPKPSTAPRLVRRPGAPPTPDV